VGRPGQWCGLCRFSAWGGGAEEESAVVGYGSVCFGLVGSKKR
jgi:hypothetical protein